MKNTTRSLGAVWIAQALCFLWMVVGCPLGIGSLNSGLALAQFQEEAAQAAREPVEPQTPEFKRAVEAFRAHLKKVRAVMVHYNTTLAGEHDRQFQDEWFALLRDGRPIYQQMLTAAVAEYLSAPNDSAPLAEMLWETLDRNTKLDRYEGMLPIAQALRTRGYQNEELGSLTARTAFAMNDFTEMRLQIERMIDGEADNPQLQFMRQELDSAEKVWEDEVAAREKDKLGPPLPRVLMRTTKGDIEIELFENQAPETVANFISLVESGYYDGLLFHRVIEQFMAQTGCPVGDGSGSPGYNIYGEMDKPNARKFFRGTVGMALSGHPDSGGSQFFFTFLPVPSLNEEYTAFGRITDGIEVLGDLMRVNPEAKEEEKKKPAGELDEIVSIKVLSKRDHEYKPNKVE